MTDLNYQPVNNIGGNYLVRVVPAIGTTPNLAPGAPITFREGFRWYFIYGTDQTKLYDEKQSISDNGPYWELTIGLFVPGDAADRRKQLAEMVRYRYILQCEDNTGLLRQIGTFEQPLELTYEFSTGKSVGDLRGYMLSFKGTLSEAPRIL